MYTYTPKLYLSNFYLFLREHLLKYPSPANLSYWWNFGFISSIFLALQIVTGIFLAMHYCSDASLAFASIQHIMNDVNWGWLLRYLHSNGASFFFIAVYLHIARNLYFRRFGKTVWKLWISGLAIFFLMMGTAFIGYVLPWGQMSFWGATVITNMVSVIPGMGVEIVYWLWGGFSVAGPTLSRFFALHYILPFVILFLVLMHFQFLHEHGSSNPSFVSANVNRSYLPLYPYFVIKDFLGLTVFLIFFSYFLFFSPNLLGHSDNYIEANPLATPPHIVPEWYFLPFYTILRAIPNKLLGVLAMIFAIAIFFVLPLVDLLFLQWRVIVLNSPVYANFIHPFCMFVFFNNFLLLGWLGSQPVEAPYVSLSAILVSLYFLFFLLFFIIVPLFYKFIYFKRNR